MDTFDFEKQLIKAVEHGCPFCGSDELTMWCIEERGYHLDNNGETVAYTEYDSFASSEDNEAECSECSTILWTTENGWIPELQEIVKGE